MTKKKTDETQGKISSSGTKVMQIKIDQFEGPLDLLLSLIRSLKLDIESLSMSEITSQYINYIHTMQDLSLEVASEYLVMAATLIEIKGRELLPHVAPVLVEENDDPKEQLIQQLKLYQQYKAMSDIFKTLENKRLAYYSRSPANLSNLKVQVPLSPGEIQLNDLFSALSQMTLRFKFDQPLVHTMTREVLTVEQSMDQLMSYLNQKKQPIRLSEGVNMKSKTAVVSYFLAFLQLVRSGEVTFEQEGLGSTIWIKKVDKEDDK